MRKIIYIQPFNAPVTIFNSVKAFEKFFNTDCKGSDGYCGEFNNREGETCFAMAFSKEYDEEIVNHECLHLVHFLLEFHNLTVGADVSSSELQAYLQSHIVKEVQKALYKRRDGHPWPIVIKD